MDLRNVHYEIEDPSADDLIFCFEGQEIFLDGREYIPTYREISHFTNPQKSYYCFSEFNGRRCLLLEEASFFDQNSAFLKMSLKKLAPRLPQPLLIAALKGSHIAFWRSTHRFCGRCGTQLIEMGGERARRCDHCQQVTYPRISPCIIVLVTQNEKMLLARSPHFTPGVYSTLAGFVEPGESAEEAVHREIAEEVGIKVRNLRYFRSQPWPFPDSLMLGFTAEYESGEIQIDAKEIEDAQWFSPTHLPELPITLSIARALIDQHLKEHL